MSIWGNAITLGGSGGGSGPTASDAILTVTVPTGSTVTAVKGGVTLTPTMWVQAADATQECALFVIAPAQFDSTTPWTVTATLGTDSATTTVLIDSNKQYDVELTYNLYLLKDGVFAYQINGNDYTTTSGDGFITIRSNGTWARVWIPLTQEMIDKPYTSLVAKALSCNYSTGVNIGITSRNTADAAWLAYGTVKSTDTFPKTLTVDLSSVANNLVGNWFKLVIQSYPYTIQLSDVYLAR